MEQTIMKYLFLVKKQLPGPPNPSPFLASDLGPQLQSSGGVEGQGEEIAGSGWLDVVFWPYSPPDP